MLLNNIVNGLKILLMFMLAFTIKLSVKKDLLGQFVILLLVQIL